MARLARETLPATACADETEAVTQAQILRIGDTDWLELIPITVVMRLAPLERAVVPACPIA